MTFRCFNPLYLALCIASTAIASPVFAQDTANPTPDESPEPLSFDEMLVLDGQSYARIYGVPLDEAMRRVLVMNDTVEAIAVFPASFRAVSPASILPMDRTSVSRCG